MELVFEYIEALESLILEYLPTIIVVAVIVGTYIFMNRPPPAARPPVKAAVKPTVSKVKAPKTTSNAPREKNGIKIFFGTQTRTAEDFSHILEKESKKIGIPCEVADLEGYDPEELKDESFVMFLVATHGEGDPTDNAKEFYLWLTSEDRVADLNGLPFTVFGLGNKTYEHYNSVARVMDKRLEDIGGKRVFERGEGDDDATLEEDFNHWKKKMWPVVCEYLGYELKATEEEKFVPRFRMINVDKDGRDIEESHVRIVSSNPVTKKSSDKKIIYDIKNPYLATVVENRELHGLESDRSCKHIEFDVGNNISYSTGDHLGIYPLNDSQLVQQLLQRLGVDGNHLFALVPRDKSGNIINASLGPMTLERAFTEHLDITNPPRKSVLKALSEYTADPSEKQRLLYLSSEDGNEEYNQFIKHDFRSIGEILSNFPGLKPPIGEFLELCPRLPARYYSISSSPNHKNGIISITSVVVNFHTPTQRFHNGVASTWLSNLKVGDKVPLFVRESHFRLPSQYYSSTTTTTTTTVTTTTTTTTPPPIIMVGPGTGLAPFRGFLQEIHHYQSSKSLEISESMLFFGCRSENVDYLYKQELVDYTDKGTLKDLTVAFSRQNSEKVYVQHKLLEHKEKVWNLLSQGAHFYVCGDARNMSKSVQQSLLSIIKEFGQKDENAAQKFIDDMSSSGRYLQDVWF
ncbi:hypothetical protein CYY_005254 [Polysphondylium violaceum]|uniref:NADPH--cytochrome P450 reductase n=1 Tax=Polysphondylium violaceum TaxID=133409 RepID=A0A8J4PUP7_9MYCE|nr:hypothetical protein CYY_005254 [Polysphondylium violaceum]